MFLTPSKIPLGAMALAALLAPAPAPAQNANLPIDGPVCANTPGNVAAATRVAACTRILDGGGLSTQQQVETLVARAWSLSLLHRMADARADYDKAIEIDPRSHVAYNERGLFHLRLGEFDAAITDYDMALSFRPDAAFSLYGRGLAYLRKGDAAHGNDDLAAARRQETDVDQIFQDIGLRP
jgi:lipoprotein NlpI